jgi:hypothetical protein
MKNTISRQAVMIAAAAVTCLAGEPFDLSWNTIDGGGVMRSSGGSFVLSGTIGQPDAGPGAPGMTGGNFTLTGGFWFETPPGDCNADGSMGRLDHQAFVNCLTGPGNDIVIVDECRCFDADSSGTIDLADFAENQNGFTAE